MRLRSKLLGLKKPGKSLEDRLVQVHHPANTEPVNIAFKTDKIAKVVGKLAETYMPLSLRPKASTNDEAEEDRVVFIKAVVDAAHEASLRILRRTIPAVAGGVESITGGVVVRQRRGIEELAHRGVDCIGSPGRDRGGRPDRR